MKNKNSYITFLLICLSILAIKVDWFIKVKDKPTFGLLNWDMFGYYLYLPSTFIYKDVGLENKEWVNALYKKYEPSDYPYQYANGINGREVNIYSMGMAVVYAPGFFLAQACCSIFNFPNDGYSKPFEFFAFVTSMLFFFLNIYLLRKLLLSFFDDKVVAAVLVIGVLGTNYFYQSGIDSVMVHNYIVTLLSAIILLTIKWHRQPQIKTAILLAFCLGLAMLIRPPVVIFVLIPLLWNVYSWQTVREKFVLIKKYSSHVFVMIATMFLIGLPQLVYFKYTSGNWLSFNRGETLDLFHAHVQQFLFSYKKGWLLYTPVMLFSLVGFYWLYKKYKAVFYPALIIVILQVWMLSSWDAWWFHTSYGQRGMVDIYSLLALPLGCLVQGLIFSSGAILKYLFMMLFVFLVYVSLFQTWQYMHGVLHWDRTTKTSYWKVFLKTKKPEGLHQFLEVERRSADDSLFLQSLNNNYNLLSTKTIAFKFGEGNTITQNGETFFTFNNQLEFAKDINIVWKRLTKQDHLFVQAEAEVVQLDTLTEPALMLAAKTDSDGKFLSDKVNRIAVADTLINKLQTVKVNYITPLLRHKTDKVTVFAWNYQHKNYLFKKLTVRLYEPINSY